MPRIEETLGLPDPDYGPGFPFRNSAGEIMDPQPTVDFSKPPLLDCPVPPTPEIEAELRRACEEYQNGIGRRALLVPGPLVQDSKEMLRLGLMSFLLKCNSDKEAIDNTPARFIKALEEMTEGYADDPQEILSKQFEEKSDEVVILTGIEFCSLCEHHLLPFVGSADVGYIPGESGRVVGLSKLARLVDCFARRLQIQERMTREIAESLMEHLGARGAAVIVRAHHSCMGCRGVRKSSAEMVTSAMRGLFRTDSDARAEFLVLCAKGGT